MRTRIALVVTFATAIFLFTFPVTAAPVAQTTIPDFTLNAQTTLAVTVAITGGQVIVVPIDLTVIAQNENGTPDISIIAQAEQQAGMFIGVANSTNTTASLRPGLADAIAEATATPSPSTAVSGSGEGNVYTVNANANLRAGPGTNFEIVGKPRFGDTVVVVGENEDGSWMQLDNGGWMAAFLLDPTGETAAAAEQAEQEEDDEEATEETEDSPDAPPTPTTVPAEDQAARASYLQQVAQIGTDVSNGATILQALLQNPQPFNDQWRSQVDGQLAIISSAIDQYLALTPVSGVDDLQAQLTGVTTVCEQAIDYLASGLETPRTFSPTLASDLTQSCAIQATDLANDAQSLQ